MTYLFFGNILPNIAANVTDIAIDLGKGILDK